MKSKSMLKNLLSGLCIFAICAESSAQIYVSPNGSDESGDGTAQKPFATPSRAVKAAAIAVADKKPVEIKLGEGVYFIQKTIALDEKSIPANRDLNLVISGSGKVLLSGAKRIDASNLREVSDKEILKKLPESLEGKLFSLDLKKFGITDFGALTQAGFGSARTFAQVEAFFNQEPLTLARYPNSGLIKIGKVLDAGYVKAVAEMQGALKPKEDKHIRGALFEYTDARHERWTGAKDAWIYGNLSVGWADDRIKIKEINLAKKTVELASPHIYGVRTCIYDPNAPEAWKVAADLDMRGYYALNLLEEIDTVGEYYIDRESGIFYVMLKENPAGGYFDFSVCTESIFTIKNSNNIVLKNIDLANGRGSGICASNVSNLAVEGCKIYNFALAGAEVRNPYGTRYNKGVKIKNCTVFNNGCAGVLLDAGYRKELIDSQSEVVNCEFYKNGRIIVNYSPSLGISGVGVKASHCYFHDQKYLMVSFAGNDLLIECNYFERCAKDASDMGIIYGGRDQSWQGNIIRYNIFAENTATNIGDNMSGVYVDDGSCDFRIEKNIFCRTGNIGRYGFAAVFLHGGHDNSISKNVFIDCPSSASHSAWTEERWQGALKRERARLKEAVDIESEVYLKKYPNLANMLKPNLRRVNTMVGNLLYNTPMPFKGDWSLRDNKEIKASKPVAEKIYWDAAEIEKYFGDNPLVKEILSKKSGLLK